ncbi:MAPEG family protein [Maritalea mediterranea]|uniref:MAPEG family protein n=1 Tax=Maritalea mediterranea TaxID=2909667 RepID=A0ABS9E739_9HYPH|nr:MAPEG family protein [Maritalea mediterranea]MCF4098695.1 MAPEG family protein [Maritalea mediterranea]
MATILLAVLALYLVQLFTPALFRFSQIGLQRYVGSRDDLPELPVSGQRASRALNNLKESLFLFLPLAILAIVNGNEAEAMLGAQIFLVARIVYAVCYLLAVPWLRSVVWIIGFVGLVMMALPLFG